VGLNLPLHVDETMKRGRRAWVAAGLEPEEPEEGEALVPQSFRHTFASHLVGAGYDVATVAEWIGH
jgi:site-specific recombinase XerD